MVLSQPVDQTSPENGVVALLKVLSTKHGPNGLNEGNIALTSYGTISVSFRYIRV